MIHYPQYEWAFDAARMPVHISEAERGQLYFCPLCGGRMVARLGDIKQHHFAHDELKRCTPENVTRAAASRWLTLKLQQSQQAHQSVMITWRCPLCQQTHVADLLDGVVQVQPDYVQGGVASDVALLDMDGRLRAVIAVRQPGEDAITYFAHESIPLIVVSMTDISQRMLDLPALLGGATILNGPCDIQRTAAENNIITDVSRLRAALIQAVNAPPHHIYGPLDTFGNLTHIFMLGDVRLWLPPLLWRRAIGGMLHAITPALQIISQEWKQDDGATIALYYVTVRETVAIAVRRFEPGQSVVARLNTALFRTERITATDIARSFAEL
ncbi:MAG: hypothetical protein JXJ20_07500 [Anaerolineae bacterium]|nr:hypothetical protein [Anaerolineae bacterium]